MATICQSHWIIRENIQCLPPIFLRLNKSAYKRKSVNKISVNLTFSQFFYFFKAFRYSRFSKMENLMKNLFHLEIP